MNVATAPPTAPATTRRSLAPDLARGFMLLAIALSHTPGFLTNLQVGITPLDNATEFICTIVVNDQARPMFVFLFGYGLTQLVLSRQRRGADDLSIRKLLRRRGFWLIVIGFAHGVFLVPLDIIATYGLASLLFLSMVTARNKTLLWTAALTFLPSVALPMATVSHGMFTGTAAYGANELVMYDNPAANLLLNVIVWFAMTLVSLIYVVPGMLLGIWAGRRRVLEEPAANLTLLRRAGWGLFGAAVIGKLPAALILTEVWQAPDAAILPLGALYATCGYLGGMGAAALVALAALRIGARRGAVTTAIVALGQRSMTFFIFQSAVYLTLFYPYTFDLHAATGYAGGFAISVGIWVVSLILADILRRKEWRGPAEALLRRMTRRWEPAATPGAVPEEREPRPV